MQPVCVPGNPETNPRLRNYQIMVIMQLGLEIVPADDFVFLF